MNANPNPQKTVQVHYYAVLREERGKATEPVETCAETVLDLYQELRQKYGFKLSGDLLKVAVNDEYRKWDSELKSGDTVVFIPPVAGG